LIKSGEGGTTIEQLIPLLSFFDNLNKDHSKEHFVAQTNNLSKVLPDRKDIVDKKAKRKGFKM
jgi:hypothetical protein